MQRIELNMKKGYDLKDGVLIIEKDLTDLDFFVKNFLEVLKKHSDYLIVSGFVSISTGRTRATEDVDMLMPVPDEKQFNELFEDLIKNDFWCYQGENSKIIYEDYVKNKENIRFAKKDRMFPNMEIIFIDKTREAKFYEFTHPEKIRIKNFEFKIPPLEFEILYKEIVLAGKKDMEDAAHLRTIFKDILKEDKFKKCEEVIRSEK